MPVMNFGPVAAKADEKARQLELTGTGISSIGVSLFLLLLVLGVVLTIRLQHPGPLFVFTLGAFYVLFAVRQVNQWERAVVLRVGRFRGLRGPGMFSVIPIVESVNRIVDQRVRVTDVSAESALTRDTVPVNVDAIVYWLVWDAEKAILEVEDFYSAISLGAQTALRETIGAHELADMIARREHLGKELQRILDDKTNPWGITVQSVEIKQVNIPPALEDAMSRQAQAERERQARIILGTAETEISEKFAKAAEVYSTNPAAFSLRAMNLLFEAVKEKGSLVIVPSAMADAVNIGGLMGMVGAAANKARSDAS